MAWVKIDGAGRPLVVNQIAVKLKSFCKMPIRVCQPDGSYLTVTFKKSVDVAPVPAPVPEPAPLQQKGRRDITPAWRVALGPPVAAPVAAPVADPVAAPIWRSQRPDAKADVLNQLFGDHSIYSKNIHRHEHNLMKFLYSKDKSLFSVSDIHVSHGDIPHYSIRITLGAAFTTYHAYPSATNPTKIDKVTGFSHGESYVLVERRY